MIPSVVTAQVRQSMVDYLRTTFHLADARFEEQLFGFLEGSRGIFRGPYYELPLPFDEAPQDAESPLEIRPAFRPYQHQLRAFERLHTSASHAPEHTLITTGTGSGKTECFLYPVLDHCYQVAQEGARGVKAILLYPMNALASDQARRLAQELWRDERLRGVVSAGLYVGGQGSQLESEEHRLVDSRDVLRDNPPDVLLTNYRMLDLLLMRPEDRRLWRYNAPDTLRYLVLDELHTYDGAQGSDVACLIRRLKSRLAGDRAEHAGASGLPDHGGHSVCCVGTSATISGGEQATSSEALRRFAGQLFEEEFGADSVVGEVRKSAEDTLGEEVTRRSAPSASTLPELDPHRHPTADAWLRRCAELWLGDDVAAASDAELPFALAEGLQRHEFLRELLRALRGKVQAFDVLDVRLHRWSDTWSSSSEGERHLLLNSFLGLLSRARVRVGADSSRPLLKVGVHLWARELRRLFCRLPQGDEGLRFDWKPRDIDLEVGDAWLRPVACRECGQHGFAALHREGTHRLEVDPSKVGRAWLERSQHARCIFLVGTEAPIDAREQRLCPRCLSLSDQDTCNCVRSQPLHTLRVLLSADVSESKPARFLSRCPHCASDTSLSILGSRAASLLSVAISSVFLSDYNDDRKLLAFTDSVQDASHRAGFFGARTYTFTLRRLVQGLLDERGELALGDASRQLIEHWRDDAASVVDQRRLLASLVPHDLRDASEVQQFLALGSRDGSSGAEKALVGLLEERLQWELCLEFGLNARVGRTLELTGLSTLRVDPTKLAQVAELVTLELNESTLLDRLPQPQLTETDTLHFLRGLLHRARHRGAVFHRYLAGYGREGGKWFLLTRSHQPHLSPFGSDSVLPRFLVDRVSQGRGEMVFDSVASETERWTWFRDWAQRALGVPRRDAGLNRFYEAVLRRLREAEILLALPQKRKANGTAFALDPSALHLTPRVTSLGCSECRRQLTAPEDESAEWIGQPCIEYRCAGRLEQREAPTQDYYRRIYTSGQPTRIFCDEHTSLLSRPVRESVEESFKSGAAADAPNLLVCTPTLEMGIDVGDLSSTALCSVPPRPANYLQRIGRAGRRTGNALSLTISLSRPHDLYFHEDPEQMLAGKVEPPGCFLDAPEMLRRQLVAFAFDRWAQADTGAVRIPSQMRWLQGEQIKAKFPRALLEFFEANRASVVEGFFDRFGSEIGEENQERLREYASGSQIAHEIEAALEAVADEIKKLKNLRLRANSRLKALDADAKGVADPDAERRELKRSLAVLNRLAEEERARYPINVLTDAGVLPNYAFPESGVVLQSYVRDADAEGGKTFEYVRPASQALRELAPFNTFYAEGRQVRINEIDLGSRAQPLVESWRLCPNCSFSRRVAQDDDGGDSCPRCRDPTWADSGQLRDLVLFRRARALSDRLGATAAAAREERERVAYHAMDLVDVSEDNLRGAWILRDVPFGFELLDGLTLREVNFGRAESARGQVFRIAGRRVREGGFLVCEECGRVAETAQCKDEERPGRHAPYCPARKVGNAEKLRPLLLYREITSEAIRVLLPAIQIGLPEKRASIKAALELGFRRHFHGDPGHLQIKATDEPVPSTKVGRRQFLLIYDAVPGGTGYLSELWYNGGFETVLRKALDALEECECQQRLEDGCYHCLYAYQVQRDLPLISSKKARDVLREILGNWESLEKVETLSDVSLDSALESELERRFLAELEAHVTERIDGSWDLFKGGYQMRLGAGADEAWMIEPQVTLGEKQGVGVASRPDFLLRPLSGDPAILPAAVFCDGFRYHVCPGETESRLADDFVKRRALLESGKFAVWSITWEDLELFSKGKEKGCPLFEDIQASRWKVISQQADAPPEVAWSTRSEGSLSLLLSYLRRPRRDAWRSYSRVLAGSWLASGPFLSLEDATQLERALTHEIDASEAGGVDRLEGSDAPTDSTWSRAWRRDHVVTLAQVARTELERRDFDAIRWTVRLFDDEKSRQEESFGEAWQVALQAWNHLQFVSNVNVVTTSGIDREQHQEVAPAQRPAPSELHEKPTDELEDRLSFTPKFAHPLLRAAVEAGVDIPPEDDGVLLDGVEISTALAWPDKLVAVLSQRQADDERLLINRGWTVFVDPVEQEELLRALAAAPGKEVD